MRPIPVSRHPWAAALFLAVVAGGTMLTFREVDVPADQANMLTEVLKSDDPVLYPNDEVFATGEAGAPWQLRLPAYRRMMQRAVHAVGRHDPVNALRLIGAVCALIYLVTMYTLLYRQTHSSIIAMLVAVMSMAIFSVRRPYWGIGPIFSVTPAGMAMCLAPLLVLLLVNSLDRWRAVGVFFLAGVLGNIHAASAANLVAVMAIVVVAIGRARPRAWGIAATGVLAGAIGASGAIVYYIFTWSAAGARPPEIPIAEVRRTLQLAGVYVLYPAVLIHALRWLPLAALLAAPPVVLALAGRYKFRELGVWLWFLAGAAVVAFGVHGLSQLTGELLGIQPPVLGFFQALRLAMLALYVLLAQSLVHLVRMTRTNRHWAHAAVGAMAVVYLGTSFNTLTLRHMVRDAIIAVAQGAPDTRQQDRRGRGDELHAIAAWAEKTTPIDALFVTEHAQIRMRGRRSITGCPADVAYLYHLAPDRMRPWADRLRKQRRLLRPPDSVQADAESIVEFVDEFWRRRGGIPAPTYVLIAAEATPAPTPRLTPVQPTENAWGRHWRLLEVAFGEAQTPATTPANISATAPGHILPDIVSPGDP